MFASPPARIHSTASRRVSALLLAASVLCSACGKAYVHAFQPNLSAGGRAVSIAMHPADAKQMLVASESGGLFRSSDGGKTWTHIPGFKVFAMGDVAYAPGSPDIVIATTRADFRGQIEPIWRSTDGGSSWSAPATAVPAPGPRCTARPSGYGISFEPGTSNVFVGTDCGLAVSSDDGASWSYVALDSLAAVTADRRQNRVWSVLAQAGGRLNVAADDGLWFSTDRGAHWHRSTGNPVAAQPGVVHAFAASPFEPAHLLLAGPGGAAGELAAIYVSSDSGASWTEDWPIKVDGRPVFVRASKSAAGAANTLDAYAGDGVKLFRRSYTSVAAGAFTGKGSWSKLTADHDDPSDVAFDQSGDPLLLATDGGLHVTNDKGSTWTMAGGGAAGYDALQVYDLTGQEVVSGGAAHLDLYFGTQDDSLWASADGGGTWPNAIAAEGDLIRTAPTSNNHSGAKVTGVACAPCGHFIADAHFAGATPWSNAPAFVGAPAPLGQPGHYLQYTQQGWTPPWKGIALTKTYGQYWSTPYVGLEEDLIGPPIVVGPANDPVVYQAVRRPGATVDGFEHIGLVRISNLYGLGDIALANADGNGEISLSQYSSMYFWGPVIGVDPDWPNHLLVADVETHQMRESLDGGNNWTYGLLDVTDAVTDTGRFVFQIDEPIPGPKAALTTVRRIAFDPVASDCHVLIGTRGNGVIRTADGGVHWSRVPGSEAIGDVTSLYFPLGGTTIYASSYGRGLWRLTLDRPKSCSAASGPGKKPSPEQVKLVKLHDFADGTTREFRLGAPLACDSCQLVLIKDGQLTDLELAGTIVRRVMMSGGSVHQFDARGRPIALSVPNDYRSGLGSFSGDHRVAAVAAEKIPVRGVVLERGALRGLITSSGELPGVPGRSPYIRVRADPSGGLPTFRRGAEVIVEGEGYAAGGEGESGLQLSVDGVVIARGVRVDENGRFRARFRIDRPAGDYQLIAEQHAGLRYLRDATLIHVVVHDR